jgi:uncharacterized repeat protein (TIGR03803 family)
MKINPSPITFPLLMAALIILTTVASAQYNIYSETTLYSFGYVPGDAAKPVGNIIFDPAGNIYGASSSGGLGYGTIYELSRDSSGIWSDYILYAFTGGADGALPNGGLTLDVDGNIFGTTQQGGQYNYGSVFELSPKSDGTYTETVLHSFTGGVDGRFPMAGLTQTSAFSFWGTTSKGGNGYGVVFELYNTALYGWVEHLMYTFTGGTDGAFPMASLIFDSSGNVYGTTNKKGDPTCHCGTVFQLVAAKSYAFNTIHTFKGVDGQNPVANLIIDSSGNFYGTTPYGGRGSGTIFELTPRAGGFWNYSVLHPFYIWGQVPMGPVTLDSNGNLFGSTWQGGFDGWGVVYRLSPTSGGGWHYTMLYTFGRVAMGWPQSNMLLDAQGNLYGTGIFAYGGVFEVSP